MLTRCMFTMSLDFHKCRKRSIRRRAPDQSDHWEVDVRFAYHIQTSHGNNKRTLVATHFLQVQLFHKASKSAAISNHGAFNLEMDSYTSPWNSDRSELTILLGAQKAKTWIPTSTLGQDKDVMAKCRCVLWNSYCELSFFRLSNVNPMQVMKQKVHPFEVTRSAKVTKRSTFNVCN